MNFMREKMKDYYLGDTHVENIFLNEYMPGAPGDYVKVYLFALLYADHDAGISNETIAKQLCIEEEDVLKAWSYWEGMGVIKKHFQNPQDKFHYEVEFKNLKQLIYGNKSKGKKSDKKVPDALANLMEDETIKNMYSEIERITKRLFEGKEPADILSWIKDYRMAPEVIVYAYSYCVNKRNNSKYNYVAKVVKEWGNQNLRTLDQVEAFLSENDNRHYLYKRVLKALGFLRNATEEETRIMDQWFDEMKFNIDKVLEACKKTSGISNPNINYVNSVLKAWSNGEKPGERNGRESQTAESGKGNSIQQVMKAYDAIRRKNEKTAEDRRKNVYQTVPRIKEIEDEIKTEGMKISRMMLSGSPDVKAQIRDMKKKIDNLNGEKAYLLTENNFQLDYMDMTYDCGLCKDTGILETGERCKCFAEKLKELQ